MQCLGQEGANLEHPSRFDEWCDARGRLAPSAPEFGAAAEADGELCGSNAKIKAALRMKEMPVRVKDGLSETVKSFAGNSLLLTAYG